MEVVLHFSEIFSIDKNRLLFHGIAQNAKILAVRKSNDIICVCIVQQEELLCCFPFNFYNCHISISIACNYTKSDMGINLSSETAFKFVHA